MNTAIKRIALITNAHPDRVRLLFNKYGINTEVTPKSLALAIVAYGKPFTKDLAAYLAAPTIFMNANGELDPAIWDNPDFFPEQTTPPKIDKDELSWWEKFTETLTGVGTTIDSAGSVWDKITGIFGGTSQKDAQKDLEIERLKYQQQQAQEKSKLLLYAVGGIAVFMLLIVMLMRK